MLQQLDENNREIEGQRYEIKRLREQVHLLLSRAPLEDASFHADVAAGNQWEDARSATAPLQRVGTVTPLGMGVRGSVPRERSRSSMGVKPS
mmetsp:Transcript_25932/g.58542  ORF Transcript_25932/g.58542 Transcript_25932/m.58542 type:complete len:92 (-) Transcript_25932:41-316(-)